VENIWVNEPGCDGEAGGVAAGDICGGCGAAFSCLSEENICVKEPGWEDCAGAGADCATSGCGEGAGACFGSGELRVENICVKEPGCEPGAAGDAGVRGAGAACCFGSSEPRVENICVKEPGCDCAETGAGGAAAEAGVLDGVGGWFPACMV